MSEAIIDLDGGSHTASTSGGTVSANGFSSPTIYIDGREDNTINTEWHHIVISTDTAIDANNFNIGRVGSFYLDGKLDDLKIYNYVRPADLVKEDYNAGANVRFGE